ncbi:MAG: toll/interleukin-1 receptor domain-containing protein [Prevotella sp.]|jgi:internalin A|nr:toll/interleukin-1 receptor domain-containing protein [Prevotella sp.]
MNKRSGKLTLDAEQRILENRIKLNSWEVAPPDMYLSLNGKYYIHYETLEDTEKTKGSILAYKINKENGELDKTDTETLPSKKFVHFSDNKNIKQMKKIFISYSRQDVDYKDELKKHLGMLSTFDIADNWSCEQIKIGNWHEQIQKELEDSDLIIYMLSVNFFTSKYILEQEVLKGKKLFDEYRDKKFLCVIVSDFISLDKLHDDSKDKTELQESILKLSENQYLPYYKKDKNPVTDRRYEGIVPLVRFPKNEIDSAYTQIMEKVVEILK